MFDIFCYFIEKVWKWKNLDKLCFTAVFSVVTLLVYFVLYISSGLKYFDSSLYIEITIYVTLFLAFGRQLVEVIHEYELRHKIKQSLLKFNFHSLSASLAGILFGLFWIKFINI